MANLFVFVISAVFLLMPVLQNSVLAGTAKPVPAIASPPVSASAESAATPAASPSAAGNAGVAAADGASEPTPATQKKKRGNRRWLIKQRDMAVKVKPGKTLPIKWTSTQQQLRCEALLPKLRDSFDKARYYSIQGDSCKTAAHANQFLDAYTTGTTQCPAGYLKGLGYRDLIPRNMQRLVDLGQERCQDRPKVASGSPDGQSSRAGKTIKASTAPQPPVAKP